MIHTTIDGKRWGIAVPNADGNGVPSDIFGRRAEVPGLDDHALMHYDEVDEHGFWTDSGYAIGRRYLVSGDCRIPERVHIKAMFRPVFIPMDENGTVDASAIEGIAEGEIVTVACLKDGDKLVSQANMHVPKHKGGELAFVGTDSVNERYHIRAMRVGDELLATRNVISGITYDELMRRGFGREDEKEGERQILWLDGKPWQVNIPRAYLASNREEQDSCEALVTRQAGKPRVIQKAQRTLNMLTRSRGTQDPRGISIYRVLERGFVDVIDTDTAGGTLCFVPDFIPLDESTMEPDRQYLEGIEDGEELALATLYINGKPMPIVANDDKSIAAYHYRDGDTIEFRALDGRLPEEYRITVYKLGYLCGSVFPLVSNVSYMLLRRLGFTRETAL